MSDRLVWELRYRKQEFSIKSGIAKGRAFPDWYLDRPMLEPGDAWYLTAFWDLDSERQVTGQVMGRIPWSRAVIYAKMYGMEGEMIANTWTIITTMDSGFLGVMRKEYNAAQRAQSKPKKAPATGNRRR